MMNTGIMKTNTQIKNKFDHLLRERVEKWPYSKPLPICIKGNSCTEEDMQLKTNINSNVVVTMKNCR